MNERSGAAGTSAATTPSRSSAPPPSEKSPTMRCQCRIEACRASHTSGHLGAGFAQLVEGALGVARLDVDPPDRVPVDRDAEAFAQGVGSGLLDAVVRSQADDRDVVDVVLAQELGKVGLLKAGVALEVRPVAGIDDCVNPVGVERSVQLGAGCPLHAVW